MAQQSNDIVSFLPLYFGPHAASNKLSVRNRTAVAAFGIEFRMKKIVITGTRAREVTCGLDVANVVN